MPKALNGTGSVVKRASDGRWMSRIWLFGKRWHFYGKSELEARAKLDAFIKASRPIPLAPEERDRLLAAYRGASIYGLSAWYEITEGGIDKLLRQISEYVSRDIEQAATGTGPRQRGAYRRLSRLMEPPVVA